MPEVAGEFALDIRQFERLWCGKARIPWRNPEKIPYLGSVGEEGEGVAALQRQLQACGLYGGAVNGIYDTATIDAVTQLQTATGIAPDGRVGPQTLIALYHTTGAFRQPSLTKRGEGLP
ncbi:MAG: peptidoglycan-binding protein [Desulfuromonadales bacterium]|nr:peptidoglycan-binding protein [Desulfuromonadales bacterium]NIR34241.1 peptidoglycan-binding protein [Desulfuromonadales bacterium]